MKISNVERLILLMLCDISKSLKVESGIDPEFVSDAINYDQTWSLSWQYSGIFLEHSEPTPRMVTEVADILDMWSFIEEAGEKLPAEDLKKIASAKKRFSHNLKFIGFDGHGPGQLGIARFLVEKMGRFSRFKGRDLDSHCPVEDAYREMYQNFKVIRPSLDMRHLSADQIIAILV